jgi:hypothetical protein
VSFTVKKVTKDGEQIVAEVPLEGKETNAEIPEETNGERPEEDTKGDKPDTEMNGEDTEEGSKVEADVDPETQVAREDIKPFLEKFGKISVRIHWPFFLSPNSVFGLLPCDLFFAIFALHL